MSGRSRCPGHPFSIRSQDSFSMETIPCSHWLIWISAWLVSLITSGIIFGWPSLVLLLKEDNVYRNGCDIGSSNVNGTHTVCAKQEVELNRIFTFGFFGLIGSRLVLGIILDRHGPLVCSMLGSAMILLGTKTLLLIVTCCHSPLLFFIGLFRP